MAKPIEFSREALKALSRMDRATARRIIAKIDQLATAPEELANNIKQLVGGEGLMRLRVGDWRVVYRDGQVLAIIRIASRGSVYE
jgi:mRNA interferase RelE/StbE